MSWSDVTQETRDVEDHVASGASLLENGDEQLRTDIFRKVCDSRRTIQRSFIDAITSGELKRATDRLRRGMVGCNDYANVRRPVSGIE